MRQTWFRTKERPSQEREERGDDYCRNKVRRNFVGQALHRRTAALGFADEFHDLREHGLAAHAFCFHHETAAGIQGSSSDLVACGLFHRHGFAGHHRFIDGAGTFADHAVNGHTFARADAQAVVAFHLIQHDVVFRSISSKQVGLLGREIEQCANRAAGALPGTQFKHLAQQDKRRDDCRSFEIDGRGAIHAAK